MAGSLRIADTAVQQDADGRFSLNDLHRAAGGESKDTPGRFTATQQFGELVAELSRNQDSPAPVTSTAGVGTFVARELVYAYAMWISARFHLQVIRAYDAMVTGGAALPAGGAAALTVPHLLAAQRQAQRLMDAIQAAKAPAAQTLLHGHLRATQRLLGEDAPPLDQLLASAPATPPGQGTLPGMGGAAS